MPLNTDSDRVPRILPPPDPLLPQGGRGGEHQAGGGAEPARQEEADRARPEGGIHAALVPLHRGGGGGGGTEVLIHHFLPLPLHHFLPLPLLLHHLLPLLHHIPPLLNKSCNSLATLITLLLQGGYSVTPIGRRERGVSPTPSSSPSGDLMRLSDL